MSVLRADVVEALADTYVARRDASEYPRLTSLTNDDVNALADAVMVLLAEAPHPRVLAEGVTGHPPLGGEGYSTAAFRFDGVPPGTRVAVTEVATP